MIFLVQTNRKFVILYKEQKKKVELRMSESESQEPNSSLPIGTGGDIKFTCCHVFKGILGCIGGLLIHLIISSLYQWGIINTYVTSYFKVTSDPQITLEGNAIVFPTMMISIGLTMRLGLFLSKKFGVLPILYICNVGCSACVFISSYMSEFSSNVYMLFIAFIIFYGVLFGLFAGMTFMVPIVQCNKFLPGKRMYVNGLILVGTGLGSMIFGTFSYNFLNPDKLSPDEGYYVGGELDDISLKVPANMRYLSLMYLAIGCLGTTLLIPVNRFNVEYIKSHQVIEYGDGEATSIQMALCSWVFWKKVLVVILATCGVFLINGNYKTYVKNDIKDDEFLTLIGTIGAVGNGCSRFCWNLLFNRTGYKFVMLLNIFLCICVLGSIRFAVGADRSLYLFLVFVMNCCLGGYLVITPTFSQLVFGQETGSNIYGFYWETYSIANFIQYAFVSGLSSVIGFENVIYICTGMCVLAIPLVISTTWQGPWLNETDRLQYIRPEQPDNKIANQFSQPTVSAEMMMHSAISSNQSEQAKPKYNTDAHKHKHYKHHYDKHQHEHIEIRSTF